MARTWSCVDQHEASAPRFKEVVAQDSLDPLSKVKGHRTSTTSGREARRGVITASQLRRDAAADGDAQLVPVSITALKDNADPMVDRDHGLSSHPNDDEEMILPTTDIADR